MVAYTGRVNFTLNEFKLWITKCRNWKRKFQKVEKKLPWSPRKPSFCNARENIESFFEKSSSTRIYTYTPGLKKGKKGEGSRDLIISKNMPLSISLEYYLHLNSGVGCAGKRHRSNRRGIRWSQIAKVLRLRKHRR